MQTSFTLSREDFARLQKLVTKRFKRKVSVFSSLYFVQIAFWLFIGIASSILFGLVEQQPRFASSLQVLSVFLVLALITMLIAPLVQQSALRKHMLLPNGAFLCPQTIRISESGLHIEAERGHSDLSWSSFLALEQDEKNYYLFVDAMQAVIVPKAAVAAFRADFESHLSLIKNAA